MKREAQDISAILGSARDLLLGCGLVSEKHGDRIFSREHCTRIASDGSTRRFWRFCPDGDVGYLIAAPSGKEKAELAEARAAWKIGSHLHGKGLAVPGVYGWEPESGVLVFEDLGDTRLHDLAVRARGAQGQKEEELAGCYQLVIEELVAMQIYGAEGFDESWCWDGSRYDLELMIERESGYFLRAFWQGLLGLEVDPELVEELGEIARHAGEAPSHYFLHRDFQSRNIMVKDGKVAFIDFQSGRLGPLGYDLASLIIDPYSRLSQRFQEQLVEKYLQLVAKKCNINDAEFKKEYMLLAFQRNMQIVGAFCFLYKKREKVFFADYIRPALLSLQQRLSDPFFADYPVIRRTVTKGIGLLTL